MSSPRPGPGVRPGLRQVSSWQAAEELAADWLRFFGHVDARLTGSGPDGGIDVTASGALAQVKFKAVQVGAPDLQRLFGARGSDWSRRLFFFTGTSYSAKALAYAEDNDIALFTYTLVGEVEPVGAVAEAVMATAERVPDPSYVQTGSTASLAAGPTAGPSAGVGMAFTPRPAAGPTSTSSMSAQEWALTPLGRCTIGAGVLFVGATLALVGLGALAADAENTGWAVFVAVLGLVAWAVAGVLIATGTSKLRARSRALGAAAVLVCWIPGVALWIGLAVSFYRDPDHPASAWVFAVVVGMALPGLATAALRPGRRSR